MTTWKNEPEHQDSEIVIGKYDEETFAEERQM